jgi:hypothetical protein
MASPLPKHYLLASDFDQTLSFNELIQTPAVA